MNNFILAAIGVAVLCASAGDVFADDATEARLRALEERLRQQDEQIEALRKALSAQQEAGDALESELDQYLGKVEDSTWWQEPDTFRVYWDKGIRFATSDGNFKIKFGGRIMSDWNWLDPDDDLKDAYADKFEDNQSSNYHEFRRARLYLSGTIYEVVEFKAQYEFAGGDADFRDVWMGLKNLPVVGHVRVGHHKVPMGLESLTSSKYITFMERAGTTALVPNRKTGFFVFDTELDDQLFWAIGYYNPIVDAYGNGNIGKAFAGRIAGTPWHEKDDGGQNLFHLGAAVAWEDAGQDGGFVVSNRPPNHSSPIKPITIEVPAESRWILGLEGALVLGQFSLQGEYVVQDYDSSVADDPMFRAWYLYVSYFITGEQRRYTRKYAAFSRVSPRASLLDGEGGTGALEIALRYGSTDANDSDVNGGEMDSWTIGLNWYLNPNMRIMLNYFSTDIETDEADGTMTGFAMRFQLDF